jgi:hypothetical protein
VTRPSPGSDFATSLGRERLLLASCVRSLVSQVQPTRAFAVQLLPDGGAFRFSRSVTENSPALGAGPRLGERR